MARILVADDEEALRALLQRGLIQAGHDVAVAADGAEALDRLSNAEPRFDLLLSDIRMPVMDGIALALAAARDFPDLIILLMTGYSDHHERAQNLDALIAGIVAKPFSLAAIVAHVAAALEREPAQKSLSNRSI